MKQLWDLIRRYLKRPALGMACLVLLVGCAIPPETQDTVDPVPGPDVVTPEPVGPGATKLPAVPPGPQYAEWALWVETGQFRNTDELIVTVEQALKSGRLASRADFDKAFPDLLKKQVQFTAEVKADVAKRLRGLSK